MRTLDERSSVVGTTFGNPPGVEGTRRARVSPFKVRLSLSFRS